MEIYLDNSATTRQYDEVTELMTEVMKNKYGNPSSLHRRGLEAEKLVKEARRKTAAAIGVNADDIVFTSGGTESDNMAVTGACRAGKRRGRKIITSKIEHPAVLETFKRMEEEGFEPVYLDVDNRGVIDLEQLKNEVDDNTVLISIMHVNNELGTVQPIEEAASLKKNAVFHSDCVQSFGKIPIPVSNLDLISVSGHKIHGPKGSGALWIKKGINIIPHTAGGGQEKGYRSGTENTPAIAGLGLAAHMACSELDKAGRETARVRDHLRRGIEERIKDVRFNSPEELCTPGILNVSFLGTRGEVILHSLEQDEIYVSTGSACSSNKTGKSHVLAAAGLTDREIEGAVRFSLSSFNTIDEMDRVLDKLKAAVDKFRRLGSFR
ncbi:MAG: cysteine desulfurase family protein [Eubacteriaceae bacterium]|nr:cysteine desulfurase family protein [Eubacteriaceae bacterium]